MCLSYTHSTHMKATISSMERHEPMLATCLAEDHTIRCKHQQASQEHTCKLTSLSLILAVGSPHSGAPRDHYPQQEQECAIDCYCDSHRDP